MINLPKPNQNENRFQWSIQKAIKIKSIPFLLKELYNLGNLLDIEMLENDFNFEFEIIASENVVRSQRPFMRTMNFIKNDLKLLNDDYTIKDDLIKSDSNMDIRYSIYQGANQNLIPFKMMISIFQSLKKNKYGWEEFKEYLSSEMIINAKNNYKSHFKEKDEKMKKKGGIYFWKIDDPSLNRLVELGRELGLCSFVVMKYIRFISEFKYDDVTSMDLTGIVSNLKSDIINLDDKRILTIDEIMEILEKKSITLEVLEDAILSDYKNVRLFSGRKNEIKSIHYKNKSYYKISFTKDILEEVEL